MKRPRAFYTIDNVIGDCMRTVSNKGEMIESRDTGKSELC